jgi:hypothetical protein
MEEGSRSEGPPGEIVLPFELAMQWLDVMEDAADTLQAADNLAVLAKLEPLLDDLARRLGL